MSGYFTVRNGPYHFITTSLFGCFTILMRAWVWVAPHQGRSKSVVLSVKEATRVGVSLLHS